MTDKIITILSKLLKLDASYFLKGVLFALMQQIIGVSSGLLVSYLFGHFISVKIFGEYNFILSIIGLFTFLTLPGVDVALTSSIAQGYDSSLIQSQKKKFRISLIGIPIFLGLGFFYILKNNYSLGNALIICSIAYPFLYSYTNYPAFLTAKRKFGQLALLASISSLVFLLFTTISILFFPTTIGLITGYLLGISLPAIVSFHYSKKFIIFKGKKDTNLIPYGNFLTILSVLPWISGNIGSIILAFYLGPESLALFAVASRFFTAVQKNFQVIYKPATAKLASQSSKFHIDVIEKHTLKLIFIGLFVASALWFTTPLLIHFFFTEKYGDAIRYGQFLSLALIPLPLTLVFTDMIIYQQRKLPQVYMSTLPQLIKIVLYFIVIPIWKIDGLIILILIERFIEPLIPLIFLLRSSRKM